MGVNANVPFMHTKILSLARSHPLLSVSLFLKLTDLFLLLLMRITWILRTRTHRCIRTWQNPQSRMGIIKPVE